MPQTPRIFVSHSHTNDVWCRGFVDTLQSLGYDVWYDAQSLRGGQQWRSEIEKELAARDIFIVILTPAALASQWVQKEIALADAEHKQIIPVMHQTCNPQGFLKIIQFINVVGKDYRNSAAIVVAQLAGSSVSMVQPQQAITPLPNKPLNATTPAQTVATGRTTQFTPPPRQRALLFIGSLSGFALTFVPWFVIYDTSQGQIYENAWTYGPSIAIGISIAFILISTILLQAVIKSEEVIITLKWALLSLTVVGILLDILCISNSYSVYSNYSGTSSGPEIGDYASFLTFSITLVGEFVL